jgi:N-methylhydantoinase A
MHAAGLAELYGITEIVVPAASSAFSALGCLTADFSFLQQQTLRVALDGIDLAKVTQRIEALVEQTLVPLLANAIPRDSIQVELVALMRYAAQADAIPVPFTMPLDAEKLRQDFLVKHRELFGYATNESCVIESVRAQARQPSTTEVSRPTTVLRTAVAPKRRCSFDGALDVMTDVIDRSAMTSVVTGPAIIEDAWSTVVLPPQWQAAPDSNGNLYLAKVAT